MSDLRIGELSRRTGVSAELLRAWERRYGVLTPRRTSGGFRLYSEQDVQRIRVMQREVAAGVSPAEAAATALGADERAHATGVDAGELEAALDDLDDARAHEAFDGLLASLSLDTLLRAVILPYLRRLGERWESGEASVAQEHFASNLLRGRLLGLARGWDRGVGPRVLLACPSGEHHDLPLIVFGLALRARGWRVTYLGADTPVDTIEAVARELESALVVLSATESGRLEAASSVTAHAAVAFAGAGATPDVAAAAGARLLPGDPLTEAETLTGEATLASPADARLKRRRDARRARS